MLTAFHALNALLMIALPLALGDALDRRLGVGWGLYVAGAATFIASQVVHLPLNSALTALFARGLLPAPPAEWKLLFNAVLLGLTAGLCEEGARYVAYRRFLPRARSWRAGLMFGAGHGGIEAILLGILTAVALYQLAALRETGLSSLSITPEQAVALQKTVDSYWSAPWPATLLGALERAFALCLHLSLAQMVLQSVVRRNGAWLGAAVAWHAAANAVAVYVAGRWGVYWAEAAIGAFALASVGLVLALRTPEAPAEPEASRPGPAPAPAAPAPESEAEVRRRIDDSRYTH